MKGNGGNNPARSRNKSVIVNNIPGGKNKPYNKPMGINSRKSGINRTRSGK